MSKAVGIISVDVEPVGISGLGVVSAIGDTIAQFTDSLRQGRSGIASYADAGLSPVPAAAVIAAFNLKRSVDGLALPANVRRRALRVCSRLPLLAQATVCSALQACCDAQLFSTDEVDWERVGIALAAQNSHVDTTYQLNRELGDDLHYVSPNYGIEFLDTALIGVISEIIGCHGFSSTVGGASASGNLALIQACEWVRHNTLDICLVIGAAVEVSPLAAQAWINMGAMSHVDIPADQRCRPFDSGHSGFVYGQGAGTLVIERAESQDRRQHLAHAYCLGEGFYLDANRLANPNQQGQIKAMARALERAGINAGDIQYINAHGSASPLGDKTEAESIKAVFSASNPSVRINSSKSLLGHCLYSAGLMEAIATVVQITGDFIHPNLNLDSPIDGNLAFLGHEAEYHRIQYALSNSYGFGGFNSSLVMSRA